MPVLEVEIGDPLPDGKDGEIKTLPPELQRFVNNQIAKARRDAEDKVERRLQPYVLDPVDVEKLRQRAKQADELEIGVLERDKRYEEALSLRDKKNAELIESEKAKTAAAVKRVRESVAKSIRAAAATSGARAESLDELERLLGAEVDLDDTLTEFVKDADGKPRVDDKGQRVTIEGLVADYLKTHAHHVAVSPAKGGKAPGGTTFSGRPPVAGDARSEARANVAENPTTKNVAALLNLATRRT